MSFNLGERRRKKGSEVDPVSPELSLARRACGYLGSEVDPAWPLKLFQSFTTRVLQTEHFQPREGWGRFLGNGGPLTLPQSFTTRLLQNKHFQPWGMWGGQGGAVPGK